MRAFAQGSWLISLALVAACGADKERAAPATPSGAGSGGTAIAQGGVNGGARSGGTSNGGSSAAGDGAAGDSAGEGAGGAADAGAGGGVNVAPPTPTTCVQKASWGPGARLAVSTAGDDVLGGVTPDELSLVWMSNGRVWVADRDSRDEAFSPAKPAAESAEYFAQVTLSPDGLELVGVRLDGTGFGALTRATRGEAFQGTPDEAPFDALYGAPAASYSNGPFADPVFSASGTHLFYSALELEANRSVTLYDAREAGGTWPWGAPVLGSLLYAEGGAFRRPTAISSDQRTLFYWDEVAGEARMTWRSRVDTAFSGWESLGARRNAIPNAACDRLYYVASGSTGDDLFTGERN